ncbi:MAG: hypothetical protein GOP50_03935 [Candidatus Heimdallarchaeota archaeon]|nr:hypothetical protein [Candidatus Heimdallarchaeota archaeon]
MNYDELGEKLGEEIEKKVKKTKSKNVEMDAEEIKEILSAVSSEVPSLIRNVFSAIYDPDIATNFGKGIAALYDELKGKGLPEDMVREIVMNFSNSFNLVGNALKSANIRTDRDD